MIFLVSFAVLFYTDDLSYSVCSILHFFTTSHLSSEPLFLDFRPRIPLSQKRPCQAANFCYFEKLEKVRRGEKGNMNINSRKRAEELVYVQIQLGMVWSKKKRQNLPELNEHHLTMHHKLKSKHCWRNPVLAPGSAIQSSFWFQPQLDPRLVSHRASPELLAFLRY